MLKGQFTFWPDDEIYKLVYVGKSLPSPNWFLFTKKISLKMNKAAALTK